MREQNTDAVIFWDVGQAGNRVSGGYIDCVVIHAFVTTIRAYTIVDVLLL